MNKLQTNNMNSLYLRNGRVRHDECDGISGGRKRKMWRRVRLKWRLLERPGSLKQPVNQIVNHEYK